MKTMNKAWGMLALTLTFALVLAACPSPSSDGPSAPRDPVKYTVGDVVITISDPAAERAAAPRSGDKYVITKSGTPISSGNVKVDGGTITFTSNSDIQFSGTLSGDVLTVPVIIPDSSNDTTITGFTAAAGDTESSASSSPAEPTVFDFTTNTTIEGKNAIQTFNSIKNTPGEYIIKLSDVSFELTEHLGINTPVSKSP